MLYVDYGLCLSKLVISPGVKVAAIYKSLKELLFDHQFSKSSVGLIEILPKSVIFNLYNRM